MKSIHIEKPIWPDNTIYFLTDATYLHYPYFRADEQKQIVLDQFKKINEKYKIPFSAYSIAVNHYHIKFYLPKGVKMGEINQLLRGGISFTYKKFFKVQYNEMWQTRKIFQVWTEEANWKITGYIIGNLLKHKEISTFKELTGNKYSSYWYFADKYGEDVARELVYQVIGIEEDSWGGVDINSLRKVENKFSK